MKIVKNRQLIFGILILSIFYSCKKSSHNPVPPAPLPANIMAYWPLDNNKANDKSRYGNNGVVFNTTAAADRFGNANSAIHFDGTTSYIAVPDSLGLRLANTDFTINAWIKLDSYDAQYASAIISKRLTGANNGWLWAINGQGNTPLGAVYFGPGGGNSDAIGTTVLNTGSWYMITCVYTSAQQTLSIYVNGALDHSVTNILSPNPAIATALFIGKDEIGPNNDQYYFHGTMDEMRIYNNALGAADIQSLYTATN